MSETNELLVLRLALIAIIFIFVLVTAATLTAGLRPRNPRRARAPVARSPARLVVVVPADTGLLPAQEIEMAGDTAVGRDAGNGIILGDPSISGRHALLRPERGHWRVLDFESTNGTLVNGRSVPTGGRALRDGDQVEFGAVVFRFHP